MDLVSYVAIAIAIYVAVFLYAAHHVRIGGSAHLPLKWLGFAGMTAMVFGYAIRAGLRSRAPHRFWVLLGAFAGLHMLFGLLILYSLDQVPLVVFGALMGIEYAVLVVFLDTFLRAE